MKSYDRPIWGEMGKGLSRSYGRREFIKTFCGGMVLLLSSGRLEALERPFSGSQNSPLPTMLASSTSSTGNQSKYPETVATLQTLYGEEVFTQLSYSAFAPRAVSEGYPNIGHLFTAFMVSETIHARNFLSLLNDFGAEVKEISNIEISVASTKKNLKKATSMELRHIDQVYPQSIEKVYPEAHEASIWNMKNAWEGEKQHRDLIEKIQSGTGFLFGFLARRIEGSPSQFFVCEICGSTVTKLPENQCLICKRPGLHYQEVKKPKEVSK